ncbi:MAG: NADH-quinone oxidoreductase subunit L [Puniceicoccales bacterium]|nr:NADH-quinone oxidoreductase subunit L [Puniceicoccales bacterium]
MEVSCEQLLWVLLLTPLGASVISAFFLRRSRWGAPVLSLAASAVVLGAVLQLFAGFDTGNPLRVGVRWISIGNFHADLGFLIDANAVMMLFVVSFVAFWVHVFSIGYMDKDAARGRFFAGLSIFLFSMLGVVVADNLFMIFFFWELVGFSSYLLIVHYHEREEAVAASMKAFIVNRIGDIGFLAGIVACRAIYGTADLVALGEIAGTGAEKSVIVGALLCCGFLGKSAQFPLHVWLPDAMAGPTPVSALIHAATMVAAGVYFLVRVFPLFPPPVLEVLLWTCSAMALLAALCALAQTDIKKSLAYSTLSHLGFMGVAVGFGIPELALLHLLTHAFFKATLFLCAGSVIHACHHEQDMRRMGGLARRMPLTAVAFGAAGLSLCAFPFTSGWFSKDAILAGALLTGRGGVFVILLLAAFVSALYIGRIWQMVFGRREPAAIGEAAGGARERNLWMGAPVGVLGIYSIFACGGVGSGWVFKIFGIDFSGLLPVVVTDAFAAAGQAIHEGIVKSSWQISFSVSEPNAPAAVLLTGYSWSVALFFLSALISVGGIALAVWFYKKTPVGDSLQERFPRLYAMLEYRWIDACYDAFVAKFLRPFANAVGFLDTLFVTGLAVRAVGAGIPALLGLAGRRFLHTGNLRGYLLWFVIGSLIYGAVFLIG